MKKWYTLTIAVLLCIVAFLFWPFEDAGKQGEDIVVAATIFPVYDIARTIAGDTARVELIVPPGASPHFFEPTPSVLKNLDQTDLVFSIGEGFDDWTTHITEQIHGVTILPLDQFVVLRPFEEEHEDEHGHEDEEEHEDEDGHEHGDVDPHYWLDPTNAQIIAQIVADELEKLNPDHANTYHANAERFIRDLQKRDADWKKQLQTVANKEIVTFHDAFGYFADHFGLDIVATFEPFPGQEPTPQYLANVQNTVKEKNIRTLYIEPQFSADTISQFSEDLGVSLGVLDPIGGVEDRQSYVSLINYNVETVINTQ